MVSSALFFDFNLTSTQERHALLFHKNNIIVDMHNGGPIIYTRSLLALFNRLIDSKHDLIETINKINKSRIRMITCGSLPEYKQWWDISGVTVGCKTVGIFSKTPFTYQKTIKDIGMTLFEIDYLNWFSRIIKYKDILETKKFDRHGVILRLENTTQLGLDIRKVNLFYNLGVRIIQLTYNIKNKVGCGCMSLKDRGLTEFGKKLIRYLNKKGILIDVSHCGYKTTMEAISYSKTPVIATHTFCRTIYNHPRGKSDKEIKYLAKKGGVMGISINPSFFIMKEKFSINDFLDHIDHAIQIAGIKHIGIGTDWDCTLPPLFADYFNKSATHKKWYDWKKKIEGYRDARDWLNIIRGLVSRGYKNNEVKAIIGSNFVRIFKEVVG